MQPKIPDWLKLVNGTLDGSESEVTLLLCEPVGFNSETWNGMTSKSFGEVLAYIPKEKTVNLQINTLGGLVHEGVAIYNMIVARGNVNTCVIGYAASMGAVILQAGNKRTMMQGTMVLVHPVSGDSKTAEGKNILKTVTGNLIDIMSVRTKQEKKVIAKMMEASTAMGPKEAMSLGFCDEIVEGSPTWNYLDLASFANILQKATFASGSGQPANEEQQKTQMKNIVSTLCQLKLVNSASLTDEIEVTTQLNEKFSAITTERNNLTAEISALKLSNTALKTENDAHAAALKLRVETKVKSAVTAKLIKAERELALIAAGLKDESAISFLDDLATSAAPIAGQRRGAPPVPPAGGEQDSAEDQIAALRIGMKNQTAAETVETCRKIRDLRGHKGMLVETE